MNVAFVFGMYKSDVVEAHGIWSGSDAEHSSSTVDCNRIIVSTTKVSFTYQFCM